MPSCVMAGPRVGPKAPPRTGSGRPPTSFLRATNLSCGWPAFAGHDAWCGRSSAFGSQALRRLQLH
jgi:hypothetical protein